MDSFTFTANCVVTEQPDGEFQLVGFADDKFATRIYLMLQRALEHDEQDCAQGMDTYHVEWCTPDQSGYGGISRCELRPGQVDFGFEPEVAAELDGMTHLRILFRLKNDEFDSLRAALVRIFRESDCLVLAGE